MPDWTQVITVAISAPVAAAAALAGAWLQGSLSRRTAAEAYDREIIQDHYNAVRVAVSDLLTGVDIAAQAVQQLIDPQEMLISKEIAKATGINIPRDKEVIWKQIDFARHAFTDILSKMNETRILEPALLSDSMLNEIRTAILQLNHIIILNLREEKGNIRGGMKLEHVDQLYSLHSKIASTYNSWVKQTGTSVQEQNAESPSPRPPVGSARSARAGRAG